MIVCPRVNLQHHGDNEDADGDLSEHEDMGDDGDARNRCCYNFNRHGMGGNNHGNNDPFAKIKFSLSPLVGSVDPEAYLDWELTVQQKLDSHNVPAECWYPLSYNCKHHFNK